MLGDDLYLHRADARGMGGGIYVPCVEGRLWIRFSRQQGWRYFLDDAEISEDVAQCLTQSGESY